MDRVRGTCVAVAGYGILLRGPSGAGKSDLALRLIYDGCELVSDDYTDVQCLNGNVVAKAPYPIRGLLEIYGIGIIKVLNKSIVPLYVVIDLVSPRSILRAPSSLSTEIEGVSLPLFFLAPFEQSSVPKVRQILNYVLRRSQ